MIDAFLFGLFCMGLIYVPCKLVAIVIRKGGKR